MSNKEMAVPGKGGALSLEGEDITHGGISSKDLELPRVNILQALSPDVIEDPAEFKPGTIINSITKEILPPKFIPLFAFKQYAKFDEDGKLDWSTMDKTDVRVEEGLVWTKDDKGESVPPEVTEFLNVLCVFEDDTEMPLILSFKKSSLKLGRQFLTLIALKGSGHGQWYSLATKQKQDGQKNYFVPKVVPSKDAVPAELSEACAAMVATFKPLIQNIKVEEPRKDEDA